MAGGGGQQPLIVGITAHHPVQDDDVCRLHLLGRGCNIHKPTRHPISHPGPFQQSRRLRLVTSRDLQVRRCTCPTMEQLNLEVTHSPPISSTEASWMPRSVTKDTIRRWVSLSPRLR